MSTKHPFQYLYTDTDKIAVFVDGANLYAACRALDFSLDFKSMRDWLAGTGRLLRINYYTALLPQDGTDQPIRKMIDYLDYNGYHIVSKDAKEFVNDTTGSRKIKGNMDIEIAVDMLQAARAGLDGIILFSGDGDFCYLLDAVQKLGCHVTVVSTIKNSPPLCADALRRQADVFIDLADVKELVCRRATIAEVKEAFEALSPDVKQAISIPSTL